MILVKFCCSEVLDAHRTGSLPTSGLKTCDEALIAHLNMVQNLLKVSTDYKYELI